jgi:hypothetical protein
MRRWVPTGFLIVTILTTASGQLEISPSPCTAPLMSQVLASTINSRYDWPDQTVQRFGEQVLRANPYFAGQDASSLLAWHIRPRDNGCVVSATAKVSGTPIGGNAFYVDLETSLVLPDDQDTSIYVNMITADSIVLASAASQ